jgi:hypothetical protein
MSYQTIMLALLQEDPVLHRELTRSKQLLPTLHRTATALKTCHSHWTSVLRQQQPSSASAQIASAALEIAVQEMRQALPDALPPSDPLTAPFSLDAAMTYLRHHTPPA